MLNDNPVVVMLGRRGRGAVVEALRRNPGRMLHVRELARLADVPPMVATRAVRELSALRAVVVRREARRVAVRLDAQSRVGAFLATLEVPDPPY